MATVFDSVRTVGLCQWGLDLTDKGRGLLSWWNIWVIDSVSWGPEKLRWMMGDELETKERVFDHGVLQIGSRCFDTCAVHSFSIEYCIYIYSKLVLASFVLTLLSAEVNP